MHACLDVIGRYTTTATTIHPSRIENKIDRSKIDQQTDRLEIEKEKKTRGQTSTERRLKSLSLFSSSDLASSWRSRNEKTFLFIYPPLIYFFSIFFNRFLCKSLSSLRCLGQIAGSQVTENSQTQKKKKKKDQQNGDWREYSSVFFSLQSDLLLFLFCLSLEERDSPSNPRLGSLVFLCSSVRNLLWHSPGPRSSRSLREKKKEEEDRQKVGDRKRIRKEAD